MSKITQLTRFTESLELMGIIDESRPEAEPSAMEERPVEDLTREELEEEARKLRVSHNPNFLRCTETKPFLTGFAKRESIKSCQAGAYH